MMEARETRSCRACHNRTLTPVLDLGKLAVSCFLLPGETPGRAPLALVRCDRCSLVQLTHTVPREFLYGDHYWYHSSTNESMKAALADVAQNAMKHVSLKPGDTVLDIGANDGTLLDCYPRDVARIGFEPAENVATLARERGHVIVQDFFPSSEGLPTGAKIILSIAMFYDVDQPSIFVDAIKKCLAPDGVWVVQMSDLWQMVNRNAFDNICHEHLTYWSYRPFDRLLGQHGLRIVQMIPNNVNGGSMRYFVKHANRVQREDLHWPGDATFDLERLADLSHRIGVLREKTQTALRECPRYGNLVLGYGASTKGNTLLQVYDIGPALIPAIADRNPDKWGRQTVTGIPIISEEEMRKRGPDYLFVLPWHLIEGFKQREAEFLARGGQFIVPLPELRTEGSTPCQSSAESISAKPLALTG